MCLDDLIHISIPIPTPPRCHMISFLPRKADLSDYLFVFAASPWFHCPDSNKAHQAFGFTEPDSSRAASLLFH